MLGPPAVLAPKLFECTPQAVQPEIGFPLSVVYTVEKGREVDELRAGLEKIEVQQLPAV